MRVELSNPVAQRISQLKSDVSLNIILGKYKATIKAKKELAELGNNNFELFMNTKGNVQGNVPIFSKYGLRVLKFFVFEKFRIKTSAEKELNEKIELYKKGILKA